MSADSRNACPACYHRATGVPWGEITQVNHLNKVDAPGEIALKEYHENYISGGDVVFEYHGAECGDCGYEIPSFALRYPMPVPEEKTS